LVSNSGGQFSVGRTLLYWVSFSVSGNTASLLVLSNNGVVLTAELERG
jgi:hypothetical protein